MKTPDTLERWKELFFELTAEEVDELLRLAQAYQRRSFGVPTAEDLKLIDEAKTLIKQNRREERASRRHSNHPSNKKG